MARADRLERLDLRRQDLEAEYRAALIAALRTTAAGKWGLFGHTSDRTAQKAAAPVLDGLNELAEDIDRARVLLAMPCYDLHQQFLAARGPVGSAAPGEPKQAQAWLDRLTAEMPPAAD
jgi:hypothetical protein